jgi:hypothetical protein
MEWVYGGFLATWYAAFAALYARSLGQGDNALLLAFGHFVCLPVLLLGACGAVAEAIPTRAAAVDGAVHAGRVGRRQAFLAGVAGALGSMLAVGLLAGAATALGDAGWVPITAAVLPPPAGLVIAARWVEWTAGRAEPGVAPGPPRDG